MTKKIIWPILGGIFVVGVILGLVFGLRKDYAGARERVQGMLAVEQEVKQLTKVQEVKEEDLEKVEESLAAIGALKSESEKLSKSSALKDEQVKGQYEEIEKKVRKWNELGQIANVLVKIAKEDDKDNLTAVIKELKKSENKQVKKMGEELADYQGQVEDFEQKYNSGKAADYAKMQEEYGKIVAVGEKIKTKYEEMDLKKYVGMSEKKMVGLFDDLRKLDGYLEERS